MHDRRSPLAGLGAFLILIGTVVVPADAQVIIGGRIRGGIVIQGNGIVAGNDASEPGISGHRLFVENRSVTNALDQAKSQLQGLENITDETTRLSRLQRGLAALQKILELDEDFTYSPDPDDRTQHRSVKAEAERLIAGLGTDGRAFYEQETGPSAQRELDEALESSSVTGLERVARSFFHTRAGYDATYRLGLLKLDRGEPLSAALVFERLRRYPTAARRWEPLLSLQTAVAWGRAGMLEQSQRTLVEFKQRNGGDTIVLGGESFTIFNEDADAVAWLVDVLGTQPRFASLGDEDWTVFRGNSARNGSTAPASPVWRPKWQYATIERPEETDAVAKKLVGMVGELRKLVASHAKRNLITASGVHPLVVDDLVVFRTLENVRAVHIETGDLVWESAVPDEMYRKLLRADDPSKPVVDPRVRNLNIRGGFIPPNPGVQTTPLQRYLSERAFKDTTLGTLSSDGRFVYAVEDVDFPGGMGIVNTNVAVFGRVAIGTPNGARNYNTLLATEARTGLASWKLGGPPERDVPLAGAFFLGPPLPVADRLYCLVELAGEIRLVAVRVDSGLDGQGRPASFPVVEWTQSLLQPEFGIDRSPVRRLAGLSPSYSDGVLVCPTAAGAVVAVDLSRRQFLWGHRYGTSQMNVGGNVVFGRIPNMQVPRNDDEERWVDAVPTIADGYAILTPRDSHELHCIDLFTGEPAWPAKPRGDGLYVAGVVEGTVVVVGKNTVRAWRLADGSPAWSDPIRIAMPTGRGVRSGNLYHLPLRSGIATIDLAAGRLLGDSPTTAGGTPGNLVSANGILVSAAADEVVGLESLSSVETRIAERLTINDRDPQARLLRGELRLHRGEEAAALEDLETAIEAGAIERAKQLLLSTLLEGLRLDFEKYRERAGRAMAATNDPALNREFRRLHARGLEGTGRHREAFSEYVDLAGITGEGAVAVDEGRSTRWLRPRLGSLLSAVSDDDHAAMSDEIRAAFNGALANGDVDRLRRLADAFGRLPIGDDVRLALVDRLSPADALEREIILSDLVHTTDDATKRGRATALLARDALEDHRLEDARRHLASLDDRFADTVVLEGRTGRQMVERWTGEYELAIQLADHDTWPTTAIVVEPTANRTGVAQKWLMRVEGARGPHFQGWNFFLDSSRQNLLAYDTEGRERWKVPIRVGAEAPRNVFGNSLRIGGHAIVASFGTYFVVIDALAPQPKVLWHRELFESSNKVANVRQFVGPGGLQVAITDQFGRALGRVGAVVGDTVLYQSGTTLFAVDLRSGNEFWKVENLARASDVFADRELVFVAEGGGKVRVLRLDDGGPVGRRVIPDRDRRLLAEGRHVLSWTRGNAGAALELLDVPSGNVVWSKTFAGAARTSIVEGEDVAVYDPNGRFHVIRIADGTVLVDAAVAPGPGVSSVTVLRTADRYLLLPYDPKRGAQNNLRAVGLGNNNPMVSGSVAAFDRRTGRKLWTTVIEHQSLPLGQAPDLPVLVFASRNYRLVRQPGIVANNNQYTVLVLNLRSGEIAFRESGNRQTFPFVVDARPAEKRIDLKLMQRTLAITFAKETATGGATPGEMNR